MVLDCSDPEGVEPFVQHRGDEIRKLVSGDCWNHCPGAAMQVTYSVGL